MNNVENVSSTSLSCGPRSRCNRSEVLELAGAAGHVVEWSAYLGSAWPTCASGALTHAAAPGLSSKDGDDVVRDCLVRAALPADDGL